MQNMQGADAPEQRSAEKQGTVQDVTSEPAQGMSKSRMKKIRRMERYLAQRAERRKIEKDKKKARRRELAQSGQRAGPKPFKLMSESCNKFRIVIDMDFEDYMTEAEMSKSAQQVNRIYAMNRHSENPFQLYVTSLKGKVLDKFAFTNTGHDRWDINYSEKNYLEHFTSTEHNSHDTINKTRKEQFVYLTGDAEDALPSVDLMLQDESKIYVIGGLVDHNRHKNLCLERAQALGIPVAKLPLKEHVTLCQREILSTVTVFEILQHALALRKPWPDALKDSLPKRKLIPRNKGGTDKLSS